MRNGDWYTQPATKMYPVEPSFKRYKVHEHIHKGSPVTYSIGDVMKQPDNPGHRNAGVTDSQKLVSFTAR